MHTLLKGNEEFPTRDWSRLPNALATLESIIHPQNKPILDFLIQHEEVEQEDLLEETGLNPRQLKRRMDSLQRNNIIGQYDSISQPVYFIQEGYLNLVRKSSGKMLQSEMTVL